MADVADIMQSIGADPSSAPTHTVGIVDDETNKQYTDLSAEELKTLEELKIPIDSLEYKRFWVKLKRNWDYICYHILPSESTTVNKNVNPINLITALLPKSISDYIQFEITFNEVNRQIMEDTEGIIELYISPKGSRDNIPVMKALYKHRMKINNLIVCCFGAYHENDAIISEMKYVDEKNNPFTVSYDDFGYHKAIGYVKTSDNQNMPILNIAVLVKDPIADKILSPSTVEFKTDQPSSRQVLMPNQYDAGYRIILNSIGEYNLLNHIGYMEFIKQDDELITENVEFVEISDLKKDMKLLFSKYNYKKCNHCGHNEMQTHLDPCLRCNKIYYCSRYCRMSDLSNHMHICAA